jgi:hypothetical protein
MRRIDELFVLTRARSGLFSEYEAGDVPYIGNGLANNAVVGLVKPREGDRIFQERGIVVSAFAEATVQVPPFVACGRAGNGLTVLTPRETMSLAQLAYIAAYINRAIRWRFNWYRQTTVDRIKFLRVPHEAPENLGFDLCAAMPRQEAIPTQHNLPELRPFVLNDLFELKAGEHHSIGHFPAGSTPIVSCGDANNGVAGFFSVDGPVHREKLTISLNGQNTLTAKYHPYNFAAKDDVAVCTARNGLALSSVMYIQMMLSRERWRYSYYRKCFLDKLRRLSICLPTRNGLLDEVEMARVVESSAYWAYVRDWAQTQARTDAVAPQQPSGRVSRRTLAEAEG